MALGGPNSYTGADLCTRTGTASPRWPRPAPGSQVLPDVSIGILMACARVTGQVLETAILHLCGFGTWP